MDISIVIVNYNVKHFLKQCIQSVMQATANLQTEIIVIDNASVDGSLDMLNELFPQIKLIANKENIGYGKANNQGIFAATGKYCLLLNPDTVLQYNTLSVCKQYLDSTPAIGCVGVKMIDGSGKFLPESKRSFPSPEAAFYKLFGLSKLFPKNKRFGKYHLSFLNKNETHPVQVLSGAFMMCSTKLLQSIGGFDEAFFMYGEDIDLSYSIQQKGFQNYYLAETSIIHYKGESTKKGSINYVKHFYNAMIIFAKKHFKKTKKNLFVSLINAGIILRGLITVVTNFFKQFGLAIVDLLVVLFFMMVSLSVLLLFKQDISVYPRIIYKINVPIYVVLGMLSMFISGAYDKPYQLSKLIRGSIYTIISISIVYAFLDKDYRFSRSYILLTGISFILGYVLPRLFIQIRDFGSFTFYGSQKCKILLIGNESSMPIKEKLLQKTPFHTFFGLVTIDDSDHPECIGTLLDLQNIIHTLYPTDIIFDTKAIPYTNVVREIEKNNGNKNFKYHTTSDFGETIISSHGSNDEGSIVNARYKYNINTPASKRKKRLFDIISSIIILFSSPLLFWFQEKKSTFFGHVFSVLTGKKTWVGYTLFNGQIDKDLPKIKEGILTTHGLSQEKYHSIEIVQQLNTHYAINYDMNEDLDVLLSNITRL